MTIDRARIAELFADFSWANDTHDHDLFDAILTDDIGLTIKIAGEVAVGPLESKPTVTAFFKEALDAQTDTRRHVVSNLRVLEADDEVVHARAYLTLMVTDGGVLTPTSTGVYDARISVAGEEPRLAEFEIALDRPF